MLALLLPASVATGADCITAGAFGAIGPYSGGNYVLGTTAEVTVVMAPVQNAGTPTASELVAAACGGSSGQDLKFNNNVAQLFFTSVEPIKRVTVSYCDGHNYNEISARLGVPDFIGEAAAADGNVLPGPFGTSVSLQVIAMPGGARAAGLTYESTRLWHVVFGGSETSLWKVCAE